MRVLFSDIATDSGCGGTVRTPGFQFEGVETTRHVEPGHMVVTQDGAAVALDQYTDTGRQLLLSVRNERLFVLVAGRLLDPDSADKGASQ